MLGFSCVFEVVWVVKIECNEWSWLGFNRKIGIYLSIYNLSIINKEVRMDKAGKECENWWF